MVRLLRESRGIPQREKMKNNFQFESILKNANVTKSKKSVD